MAAGMLRPPCGTVRVTDTREADMAKITNRTRHASWTDAVAQITDRYGRDEISDDVAAAIAAAYQSPGTIGHVLAALASGARVDYDEIAADIARTYRAAPDTADRMALDMLSTWLLDRTDANRTDYVAPVDGPSRVIDARVTVDNVTDEDGQRLWHVTVTQTVRAGAAGPHDTLTRDYVRWSTDAPAGMLSHEAATDLLGIALIGPH
jgi:hypothetical protein